jgi:hypothetical protein
MRSAPPPRLNLCLRGVQLALTVDLAFNTHEKQSETQRSHQDAIVTQSESRETRKDKN